VTPAKLKKFVVFYHCTG